MASIGNPVREKRTSGCPPSGASFALNGGAGRSARTAGSAASGRAGCACAPKRVECAIDWMAAGDEARPSPVGAGRAHMQPRRPASALQQDRAERRVPRRSRRLLADGSDLRRRRVPVLHRAGPGPSCPSPRRPTQHNTPLPMRRVVDRKEARFGFRAEYYVCCTAPHRTAAQRSALRAECHVGRRIRLKAWLPALSCLSCVGGCHCNGQAAQPRSLSVRCAPLWAMPSLCHAMPCRAADAL